MNARTDVVDEGAARRLLGRGAAVVLPNPAPLTYVVAGTDPSGVNTAKGRPADQPVALWAHDLGTFTESARGMDLDTGGVQLAGRLLEEERITLLVPLRPGHAHPDWLAPASVEGWALLFGARWSPLLPVLEPFPVLYVSSANRTGHPPAASAEAARGMFPHAPVLDGADVLDVPDGGTSAGRRATTTLRLSREGTFSLHRHGAQDQPYPTAQAYLDALRARLRTPS
ncbi:hypothetical protein OS965_31610 [Streptomyces sp. H27-G5]|uniref:hypothetical protein n=1 Tax=Streptomyces sp. H27-G5 TaxID=2996698 RepID=UPI00226E8FD8|nr:hypothetical protein [Streptomyces sp. H27-G5]MCY0922646.1 hypothetical protein [Streptomyces sp. H27-G5]